MRLETDVVVAGGGPAGAATATFLKQRGWHVVLLDEARFPRDKVCGEGISPEAWRLLGAMGAGPTVRALRPRALRGMALTSPRGIAFRGSYGDREPGFAARRRDLDGILLDAARAAGAEIHQGHRVTDVLQGPRGATGVLAVSGGDPLEVHARLVVAAEGRRSVIARRLGLLSAHPTLRKFAVRGYWEGIEGLEDVGEMHVARASYCGIAPLGPASANVTFVVDAREMPSAAGDLPGFYHRTLLRWPRVVERIQRARLEGPPRAIGPLALVARRLSAPGVLLVGDAAGFYDPFTGEGVTLALRSAELAAATADRALRTGRTDDLRDYDRARHAATRDKFRLNRLLQRVIAWPDLADAVAGRLARRPDLADRLVGIAGDFVPARTALGPGFLWDLMTSQQLTVNS